MPLLPMFPQIFEFEGSRWPVVRTFLRFSCGNFASDVKFATIKFFKGLNIKQKMEMEYNTDIFNPKYCNHIECCCFHYDNENHIWEPYYRFFERNGVECDSCYNWSTVYSWFSIRQRL